MLLNESMWFRDKIEEFFHGGETILHIGSSTQDFRTRIQPHIGRNIDETCSRLMINLINIDMKPETGVDEVGDLTDPLFLEKVFSLGAKGVICANILEHLSERTSLTQALSTLLAPGCFLLVSGPYHFPFHPDPIDTLFRPNRTYIEKEFPLLKLIQHEIIDCGTLSAFLGSKKASRFWRIRSFVRSFQRVFSAGFKTGDLIRSNSNRISAFACVFQRPLQF